MVHDAFTIGIPLLAILFGILFNQRGLDKLEARLDGWINGLEARLDGRMDRVESRLDKMRVDLSMFYKILGEHGADIENLKKGRAA